MKTVKGMSKKIVVIGGGAAGIAAGVAAAENNSNVLLIEKSAYLGGKATAAEVGTICGVYHYTKKSISDFVVKGFTKDFTEKLATISNTTVLSNQYGLHFLPYKIDDFKQLALTALLDKGVDVRLKSEVKNVKSSNGKIKSLELISNGTTEEIEVESVIDASGSAEISKLLNLPTLQSATYQACSQIFTLSNLPDIDEKQLNFIFIKNIQAAIFSNELTTEYKHFSLVQGSKTNHSVKLKLTIPLEVKSDEITLQKIEAKGREMALKFHHIQQTKSEIFKNIQLDSLADEVGIRVLERPKGKYVLTEEDVLSARKFDSAIAIGAWPIEIWHPLKPLEMHYFNENDFYHIPVDCLLSEYLSNLFFAGRSISATDKAIASARVMGTCMQTGYAAGKIAVDQYNGITLVESVSNIKKMQIND